MYWNIGLPKDSSVRYERALQLAQKFNLRSLQDKCRNTLEIHRLYKEGRRLRSSGEYPKSIENFQWAIDLSKDMGGTEYEVKCLRQSSLTYLEMNNLKEFSRLNEKALKIARNINHRREEEQCLINIGYFHWKLDKECLVLRFRLLHNDPGKCVYASHNSINPLF